MCVVAFRTTHGQDDTRKCDTEGFVPAESLNGVVGLHYLFIISLIGKSGKYYLSYTLLQNEYMLPKL